MLLQPKLERYFIGAAQEVPVRRLHLCGRALADDGRQLYTTSEIPGLAGICGIVRTGSEKLGHFMGCLEEDITVRTKPQDNGPDGGELFAFKSFHGTGIKWRRATSQTNSSATLGRRNPMLDGINLATPPLPPG